MYRLKISPINKLLHELSSHITGEHFRQMKFLLSDRIPADLLEQCPHPKDVLTKLKHMCLIGEHNLDLLEELLNEIGLMHLNRKVQEFKKIFIKDRVVNDISQEQISRLTAPRHILVTLLIDQDFKQFNQEVLQLHMGHICPIYGQDMGLHMEVIWNKYGNSMVQV